MYKQSMTLLHVCVCFFECAVKERTHEVWLWTSDHEAIDICWKRKQRGSGPVTQWHSPRDFSLGRICDVAEVGVQDTHSHMHKCTRTQTSIHTPWWQSTTADSTHLTHHWRLATGTRPGASSLQGVHTLFFSCDWRIFFFFRRASVYCYPLTCIHFLSLNVTHLLAQTPVQTLKAELLADSWQNRVSDSQSEPHSREGK